MESYQSIKKVQAEPMKYHKAGGCGLIRDYNADEAEQEGYKVVYADGYESWSPKEIFEEGYIQQEPKAGKSLGNTCANGTRKNVSDIVFWGDGDSFKLISKASTENEGWMKSTKAYDYGTGVVLQVTTQQRNPDGSYAVAEAITNVPGVTIIEHKDQNDVVIGRRIG